VTSQGGLLRHVSFVVLGFSACHGGGIAYVLGAAGMATGTQQEGSREFRYGLSSPSSLRTDWSGDVHCSEAYNTARRSSSIPPQPLGRERSTVP
jgi:hypothetical protein